MGYTTGNETGNSITIFDRLLKGESVPINDPEYKHIFEQVEITFSLLSKLNNTTCKSDIRLLLEEITGKHIDSSTTLFPPFHTNFGKHIVLGNNVFINHACSFLDLGGIVIEDNVMIGPRVTITSENHPLPYAKRNVMVPAKVIIKNNVWIGAAATILPGVTIGENSVIAAGAVVNKNVPPNTLVGGVPAKIIKDIPLD